MFSCWISSSCFLPVWDENLIYLFSVFKRLLKLWSASTILLLKGIWIVLIYQWKKMWNYWLVIQMVKCTYLLSTEENVREMSTQCQERRSKVERLIGCLVVSIALCDYGKTFRVNYLLSHIKQGIQALHAQEDCCAVTVHKWTTFTTSVPSEHQVNNIKFSTHKKHVLYNMLVEVYSFAW